MFGEFLYDISEWTIFFGFIFLMAIAAAFGYYFGKRKHDSINEPSRSQITTIQSGVLGILALLTGVSLSMALSRFDTRKQLVLEESNDIGTAYLRTKLLPEPYASETAALIRDYVDTRLEFYYAGHNYTKVKRASKKSSDIQNELWSKAVAASKIQQTIVTGLFIQSLNAVIDDHTKRVIAMENRVPEIIFHLIIFVAIIAMAVTGYGCGTAAYRSVGLIIAAIILIASVTLVIIDLDRPRRGLIKVSQSAMENLRDSMRSNRN